MTVDIWEKPGSRQFTIGPETGSRDLEYMVRGTLDEVEVEALVQATVPAFYLGLPFQSYTCNHLGGGIWEVSVKYTRREPKEPGHYSISFDTTGGTAHITQSRRTLPFAPEGEVAPDFKGAIGVNGDTVEGCDVTVPAFTWTETHTVDPAYVTEAYVKKLRSLTGKRNSAPFRLFDANEVIYRGASGAQRDAEAFEISFKFDAGENVTPGNPESHITIGDITVTEKPAWDYLWVRYGEDVSENTLVKQPTAAYVEEVTKAANFAELFPWAP